MTIDSGLAQSESVQNFLKAVYTLQRDMERVPTSALAEHLGISPPSVTDMARRLEVVGLVDYRKHRGVVLTPEGEAIALKIIRRHRLIEAYLVEELGYAPYEVHEEAEQLEHAVSERFVQEIARKLGHPDFDPHGDPIPAHDGSMLSRDLSALSELPVNTKGRIARIATSDADLLRHILERGFKLDSAVEVLTRDPFEGPITATVDGQERMLGHRVASVVLIDVSSIPSES